MRRVRIDGTNVVRSRASGRIAPCDSCHEPEKVYPVDVAGTRLQLCGSCRARLQEQAKKNRPNRDEEREMRQLMRNRGRTKRGHEGE